jgi:hypothetical protein
MTDRRTALLWTIGWWFARRYLRRRAALAVAGVASGAAARRSKLRAVAAGFAVVGLLAGAFLAWRRLFARGSPSSAQFYSPAAAEHEPTPDVSVAAAGGDGA